MPSVPDSSFTSADVSTWCNLCGFAINSDALADLGLNSDLSVADTSDAAKRHRNAAKAIIAIQKQLLGG